MATPDIETLEEFETCELPTRAPQPGTLAYLARTNDFATSVDACATSGVCQPGTQFAIEVAPGEVKNFYVVSDTNNEVTLIMDRNVDETTVAWITRDDYEKAGGKAWDDWSDNNTFGPITALDYLESKTSDWTNISAKNYNVTDDNNPKLYSDIARTNARARMLTKTEAIRLGCREHNSGCPVWLYSNLGTSWLWLSSASTISVEFAWFVNDSGELYDDAVEASGSCGVRPVIEISK